MNKYFFKAFLTPSCWVQNYSYSKSLDLKINDYLDKDVKFTKIGTHYATLGNLRLWIGNHPYASFTIMQARPSRATILRAMDRLMNDITEQNEKETRRSSSR